MNMEGHEFLTKMTKVAAPEDFEEHVLARLPEARAERSRRARRTAYRYTFAGSAALVLAGFLVFRPAPVDKPTVLTYAERQALTASPGRGGSPAAERNLAMPVFETMDYASEFQNDQSQPATIYILEQVSEVRSSEIIY
jgi:hypothetical protein